MRPNKFIIICVLIISLSLVLVAPSFAVGTAITFGSMWGAAATGYATAHDIGIKSQQNGIYNDPGTPMSSSDWRGLHNANYLAYYNSKTAAEIEELGLVSPDNWDLNYNNTDFYDQTELWEIIQNEYQSNIYATVQLDAKTTAQLDDYYNWLLGSKLGLTRDSLTGVYLLPNSEYSIPVSSESSYEYDGQTFVPFSSTTNQVIAVYNFLGNRNVYVRVNTEGSVVYPCIVGTQVRIYSFEPVSVWVTFDGSGTNPTTTATDEMFPYRSNSINSNFRSDNLVSSIVPVFPANTLLNDQSLMANPSDQLILVTTDGVVDIPDTDDEDYLPAPLPVPWNVPYNESLDTVIDSAIDQILENELEAVEERVDPAPAETVMAPFLPFDLPSFNFSLSGIWYYVVRWVSSIGSGVALLFNVFGNIPPAMFYPVFGSAVVVIVIGVWKRFIA